VKKERPNGVTFFYFGQDKPFHPPILQKSLARSDWHGAGSEVGEPLNKEPWIPFFFEGRAKEWA